jgi:hypothetical protein
MAGEGCSWKGSLARPDLEGPVKPMHLLQRTKPDKPWLRGQASDGAVAWCACGRWRLVEDKAPTLASSEIEEMCQRHVFSAWFRKILRREERRTCQPDRT